MPPNDPRVAAMYLGWSIGLGFAVLVLAPALLACMP